MDIYILPSDTKNCTVCGKEYNKKRTTSRRNWKDSKYCSFKCLGDSKKGRPFFDSTGIQAWNKGKTGWMSEEGRKRVGEAVRERLNQWTPEQRIERHKKTVETRKMEGSFTGTLGRTGELSAPWKGDRANYNSKHKWIQKHWKKTGTCQECGKETKPFGNRRWGTEWHNKNKDYNREDKSGWVELCSKCHKLADKKLWIPDEITT